MDLETRNKTGREAERRILCHGTAEAAGDLHSALESLGGGLDVLPFGDFNELLTELRESHCAVVVFDARSAGSEAAHQVRMIRDACGEAGLLALVQPGDMETARACLAAGAEDYAAADHGSERAANSCRVLARTARLRREHRELSKTLSTGADDEGLIGCSPAIRRLSAAIERAAESDVTVLIEGREGSGKTFVARMIHRSGGRSGEAMIVADSATLEETELQERLDQAVGGTLLLESVDLLSGACQSALVRFLKERHGQDGARRGAARILATTGARLAEMTARGAFREDLYYRLNVFPVALPGLQERKEDISLLANHFLEQAVVSTGVTHQGISPAGMILLESHPWPGDVAQLRNTILRAHALAAGEAIDREHLMGPASGIGVQAGVPGLTDHVQETEDGDVGEDDILSFQEEEKRILSRALRATRGNVRRAAQLLGIGRATLYRKIQIYKLRLH